MPTFNFTSGNTANLTGGGPASMTDIQGPFTDLRSALNGNLDETNVPNLAAAFTTYKQLQRVSSVVSTVSAGTIMLSAAAAGVNAQAGQSTANPDHFLLELDPTDFNANARTTKLRIRYAIITNAVAPGVNFTVGLYPITAYGGASGSEPFINTLGTVVTGSTVQISLPAAAGRTTAVTADFNFPSAGAYVIATLLSAGMAANSVTNQVAFLEMRQT